MTLARNVYLQVKAGKMPEFNNILQSEVLPILRRQKGFKQELALVDKDRVVGISLWEDRASAETYHKETYPMVMQKLTSVTEGTPRVETYDVSMTTLPF